MKRSTVTTDRLAAAVVGLGAIAIGAAGAAWQLGRLPVPSGSALHVLNLNGIVDSIWSPFALSAVAVILVTVGLRWLYAHRPGQGIGTATLPNSSPASELVVDVNTAASAAAAALAQNPHVSSASGRSHVDRGERIVELEVELASESGALAAVMPTVDVVGDELERALGGVSFASRFLLNAPRAESNSARVL